MTTDSTLMDKSEDKDYILHSFREALSATMKWVQMSSLLITFFYSDTFFKVIHEKINDPKQTSCVSFVLLSIFSTDLQILNETYHNSQHTFVFNLQQWLRTTIDKLTEILPSLLSKKAIEELAVESFDSFINILNLQIRSIDDEGNQPSINNIKQDNDGFFDETKFAVLNKFNHRQRLIEQHVTTNWNEIFDYMKQRDYLKLYLTQNSDKSVHVINEITIDFQQLKHNTTSIQQTVEKICQTGIDKINIYLSEINEMNNNQSNMKIINDDQPYDPIAEENEIEQKAYELFQQLNEQMSKANFADFPTLFDEFY